VTHVVAMVEAEGHLVLDQCVRWAAAERAPHDDAHAGGGIGEGYRE